MNLRTCAVVGYCARLVVSLGGSYPCDAEHLRGAFPVSILLVVVGVLFFGPLRREARTLAQSFDLWIPLGCYLLATTVVEWTLRLQALAWLSVPWDGSIGGFVFSITLGWVVLLLVGFAYCAWQTQVIVDARTERVRSVEAAFRQIPRLFLRVTVVCFVWSAAVFSTFLLPVLAEDIRWTIGPTFAFGLVIQFVSAAALLRAVDWPGRVSRSLSRVLREGVTLSLRYFRSWWWLIVAQALIVGHVTFVYVKIGFRTKAEWTVSLDWLGGYPDSFRWLEELMDSYEATPLPALEFLSALALAALAIAIKLRFVEQLYGTVRYSTVWERVDSGPFHREPLEPPFGPNDGWEDVDDDEIR